MATYKARPRRTGSPVKDRRARLRRMFVLVLTGVLTAGLASPAIATTTARGGLPRGFLPAPNRQLILTDLSAGGDPDDRESMVRALLYSNDVQIDGIVALPDPTAAPEIEKIVAAYGQVRANLLLHDRSYPAASSIRSVVKIGQAATGVAAIGEDQPLSDGAKLIIKQVDKPDLRPLHITVWGAPNTLARALNHVRATRSPAQLAKFLAKIQVYSISDQDDSGFWIRQNFPTLDYIVQPSQAGVPSTYAGASWIGITAGGDTTTSSNAWLAANIRSKGPLGAVYPPYQYIMEGDTPSFLGLIPNGLASYLSPNWGGWGGRYVLHNPPNPYTVESSDFWTQGPGAADTVINPDGTSTISDYATVSRWRADFQYDLANRMDWTIKPYASANHNPLVTVNGQRGALPVFARVKRGRTLKLDAGGSTDPDRDQLTFSWSQYREAGTTGRDADAGRVSSVPVALSSSTGKSITVSGDQKGFAHVILTVRDNGNGFPMTSYRRVIVTVY